MARRCLLLVVLAVLATAAASSCSDSNPIRPVTDRAASALESTVLAALGRTRDAFRFTRFAVRYGKSYEGAAEVQRRFRIFSENLELVRSTNRRGLPYRLGINRFSDMSWEEFRASRLGAAQNCSATLAGNHRMRDAAALPETKDWREDGIVSPVKDQGHCGSCWTFSTTGALEAAYTQATGKGVSLSEQQLVDCAGAYNNFGCNGGLPSQAFEYIKHNGGLDTEESYPYQGVNGICHYKPENVGVKVLDSVNITLGAEDELKNAVGLVRPVSVAFEVISGFRQYKSARNPPPFLTSSRSGTAVLSSYYYFSSPLLPFPSSRSIDLCMAAAAANSKGRVIAGSFVARVLAGKAASPRRAVHASAYDKNLEEQVRPVVVPDDVIGSAVSPDKYWGPHPTTGVFGPAVDTKVAAGAPATGANGGGSVLDQKVWFRPLEDVEKPPVA